jgi:hypothetical protein
LTIDCVPADNRATVESAIMASVPTFASVFGGDNIFSAYWGCAINLNSGGSSNGYGGSSNTQSYVPGWSAFTVNMRTSTSSTSFDKNLLTVMPTGNVGIGRNDPKCKLEVFNGAMNVCGSSPYAVPNSKMQAGSLTIGDQLLNYGGGSGWSSNTAGLLLECADTTEIAIHDNANRIVSLIYYGGGTYGNVISMGRDMGYGTTPVQMQSYLYVTGNNSITYNLSAGPGNPSVGYSGVGLFLWGGYNNSTVVVKDYSGTMLIGIYCFYGVSANSFISISDRRIKTNIKSIENISSIIKNLNPVQFDYIQTKNSSTGFIAQEVYDVYPRAVHIDIEHIPNIMEPATINGNVVTFENKCNITVGKNNSIRICHDSNYINGYEYFITEVIDKNTFVINKNDFKSNDIYLYGMLVDDFMSVDYNQITALNTSAIQELYELIQQQNTIRILDINNIST